MCGAKDNEHIKGTKIVISFSLNQFMCSNVKVQPAHATLPTTPALASVEE